MAQFEKIQVPQTGDKIIAVNGKLKISNNPIIAFIEGDGTGPDIWRASKMVFDAAVEKAYNGKKKISWMEIFAGEKAVATYGNDQWLPDETVEAIREFNIAIKGPLTTPIGGGIRSLNVALRQKLDLFACVRPVKYYSGVPSPMKKPKLLDIIIFRENTEDVYSGIEFKSGTGEADEVRNFINTKFNKNIREASGIGIKPISEFGSARLAKNEFPDLTVSEDELWGKYNGQLPEGKILIKDRIADSIFQQLLLRPDEYEVLATPNLNGDYLSDAAAAQVGGLGMAPGANISYSTAIFEATHGTAPKYAGMDKVNPGSVILSGVMMFDYMGWNKVSKKIEKALKKTIKSKVVTYDFARQMKGAKEVKTSEFAKEIIKNM
jgi:isocitrate dehydrogenase